MSVTGQRPDRKSTPRRQAGGFTPRTADALPRPESEPERQVGRGLLALLGALLLIIGIPALLVVFVGNPLPSSLPDASWLQADLTAEAIINVFAVLVWIIWAHFVICMLTEAKALRAGRMPQSVLLGSASQMLARRLIAGILLLSGTATATGNVALPDGATSQQVAMSATVADSSRGSGVIEGSDGSVVTLGEPTSSTRVTEALNRVAESAADQAAQQTFAGQSAPTSKFYEVKPPAGRNYDTLWDIADRHLGDPFRYKEIFELNRDRTQPDGRTLVDADLIHPGWQLVMPADAEGPDIYEITIGPRPTAGAASTPSTPSGTGTSPGTDAPTSSETAGQGSGSATEVPAEVAAAETEATSLGADAAAAADLGRELGAEVGRFGPNAAADAMPVISAESDVRTELRRGDLGEMALGGGLILAGILVALSARRGPYGTPEGSDQALRLESRPGRADLLDRALRGLAEGRRAQQLPLPDIAAVYLNDDQVVVHVAGNPAGPPAPWAQADEGRSWTVRRENLEDIEAHGPAPWPALVNIAESHGYDLLIDLEYAPGLISLAGDDGVARGIAHSLAADLATHPWSEGVQVSMVGFGGDIASLSTAQLRAVPTIEEAIAEAEQTAREQDDLIRALGVDGVLSGRGHAAQGHALRPHVLILSGTPSEDQATRLNELISGGRSVISAVCVGNSLAARWRFTADAGGSIDLGPLGVSGTARRLGAQAVTDIRALLLDASSEAAQRTTEAAVRKPAAVAGGISRPVRSAQAPPDRDSAPVRVELLGPVQVSARTAAPHGREALLTELVAVVALHADGVHESVLRVALWPRGVEDDVLSQTLSAAQHWIGNDSSGRPLLQRGEDERWRLNPVVHVDWHEFADIAAGHQDDPQRLLAVLDLARGPAFSAVPPGRYTWLAFHHAAREARVLATTTARHAASAFVTTGDRASAESALRRGLRLVPTAQALWRDMIRLTGDDGPGGVSAVVAEMRQALQTVPLEAETQALVEHVEPRQGKIS